VAAVELAVLLPFLLPEAFLAGPIALSSTSVSPMEN
jgi:hypothetical protein